MRRRYFDIRRQVRSHVDGSRVQYTKLNHGTLKHGLVMVIAAALVTCRGSDGPQGPIGATGPKGSTGPAGSAPDLSVYYTKAEVDLLFRALQPNLPQGSSCDSDRQCASGNCVDGVCCNEQCTGNCRFCALQGSAGQCLDVPDREDPRHACQVAEGGDRLCGGMCLSGQCAFADIGTQCGTCAACDGNGRCTATPPDDNGCGIVDCSGLDTSCRSYRDLTANRCAALGSCKQPNDPATCVNFANLCP